MAEPVATSRELAQKIAEVRQACLQGYGDGRGAWECIYHKDSDKGTACFSWQGNCRLSRTGSIPTAAPAAQALLYN